MLLNSEVVEVSHERLLSGVWTPSDVSLLAVHQSSQIHADDIADLYEHSDQCWDQCREFSTPGSQLAEQRVIRSTRLLSP